MQCVYIHVEVKHSNESSVWVLRQTIMGDEIESRHMVCGRIGMGLVDLYNNLSMAYTETIKLFKDTEANNSAPRCVNSILKTL